MGLQEKETVERAKEAQREYYRKWRKDNPEKVALYQKRFWDKKAAQMIAEQNKKQAECCSGG